MVLVTRAIAWSGAASGAWAAVTARLIVRPRPASAPLGGGVKGRFIVIQSVSAVEVRSRALMRAS